MGGFFSGEIHLWEVAPAIMVAELGTLVTLNITVEDDTATDDDKPGSGSE